MTKKLTIFTKYEIEIVFSMLLIGADNFADNFIRNFDGKSILELY